MSHCTIAGNTGALQGGGVYCDYASPTITECRIVHNQASFGGGLWFFLVKRLLKRG